MGLLRDDAQLPAVAGQVIVADIDTVHENPASRHVVEPGDELDQGGLAGACLADQGHGLAGCDAQADPADGLVAEIPVLEVHVGELDLTAEPPGPDRADRLGRAGRRPQQRGDPAQPDGRLLVTVEHLRQLLDGREQQVDIEQVGDQPASGKHSAVNLAGRGEKHQGARDRGQRLHEWEVQRYVALRTQP